MAGISLVNRTLVAGAFDRQPDGVISPQEFEQAGVKSIHPEALATINEGGEQGDTVTVGELARALKANRVAISADGALKRIDPSQPWDFPRVADQELLETYQQLVPRLGRYNPNNPDAQFEDRVFKGYKRVEDGRDSDGNIRYRQEAVYEDETNYYRLANALRPLVEQVLAGYKDAQEPGVKAAYDKLLTAQLGLTKNTTSYDVCWKLYRGLQEVHELQKPVRPEVLVTRLDAALNRTEAAIADQERIVRDLSPAKARQAVDKEIARLKGPTGRNFAWAGIAGALGAGGGWFFAAGASLAGLPLVAAIGGAALAFGAIGWVAAHMSKGRQVQQLRADLALLGKISPRANRQELEQQALASYMLLQGAREADFLAALRGFEVDAARIEQGLAAVETRAQAETKSLRAVEALVVQFL